MSARYNLSVTAAADIASILAWSQEHFGESARLRYEWLLIQAIEDVAADPERPGSHRRDEIAVNVRTYHLWHSRERVPEVPRRVIRPRHLLVYRIAENGRIEIGRVLHDSMELAAHLPSGYRA